MDYNYQYAGTALAERSGEVGASDGSARGVIGTVIRLMRPRQWTKNLAVFVAIAFSQNITNPSYLLTTVAAFAVFCLASGAVYIMNDLMDMEQDRLHPDKRHRPLPSGMIQPGAAAVASAVLGVASLAGAYAVNGAFAALVALYLAVQVAYSLRLKHVVIMDVFSIAAGFFIRVMAGAVAIGVSVSSWLLACTFFLSLFLALTKRRHEIVFLEGGAEAHRPVYGEYNALLLDQMISVVTSGTVVVYALYTFSAETVEKFHTDRLKYSIPFVLYGIYRYLYLVYHRKEGGSPESILLGDKPMIINILLYCCAVWAVLYYH